MIIFLARKNPIASILVRWRRSSLAETDASDHASACCYRGTEYIGVRAVIVPKFKLGNVEREIFAADFVKASHDAALQQRPEAINRLSVHDAINILLFGVTNEGVRIGVLQITIAGMFIGS